MANNRGALRRSSLINDDEEEVVYGKTPEIEAALTLCVEQVWQNYSIEEKTGTIRRDEIRRYIMDTLRPIEEAQLSMDEFDHFFKQVDTKEFNKLNKAQVKELIAVIGKF